MSTLYTLTTMTDASAKDIRAECEAFTMVSKIVGSRELRHNHPEIGNSFKTLVTISIARGPEKLIKLP